ncbi:MAG: hypothetical protein A3F22_03815 [Candidatus Magasanikbacteria bacterium RIFCSPHIGHO2_12_FULL_41_16]|uniref:PAS fold-4 domain-containing protein n=1 Tax=Candidatus Wildermuthbacteria bacterium RIFCSPHIGHO2_02_FULL_45_25 TaxID=1802450 RepID=A0A1G2R253_9BACT|nr:MAG: hypothetical protein A3F22_03815 [Candidatus Magasanikbacteria bacterium RIFCSPHIGHO2_12_FULL_41_16]OHA66469.1 MAG: hypothetical protein A3C04_01460 [Candidatus Wildermuthbacteria bacterium RIFCSPHIGHO2_02_FULL_45_25]
MKNNKVRQNGLEESKKLALHCMKTLVEVAREAFLILDADLKVISANDVFYDNFQVTPRQTENMLLFDLGNNQWNIPELKRLLEEILPKKKTVKDYEVTHVFEVIGERTMLLNARQIDSVQLIIIAIEDITARKNIEMKLTEYTKGLEIKVAERTRELANRIEELEKSNKTMVNRELKMVELKKEIADLKKRVENGNGKNGNGKNHNGNHKNAR